MKKKTQMKKNDIKYTNDIIGPLRELCDENELLYKIGPLWEDIVRSKCSTYVVYECMSTARK